MVKTQLTSAIGKGLLFLARTQLDDGGFSNYSWPDALRQVRQPKDRKPIERRTIFFPALILSALSRLRQPHYQTQITTITQRLAEFLLTQRQQRWTWNYWHHQSSEYSTTPYPDDLDDTATALAALYQHHPSHLSGEALAIITKMLTTLEQAVGGPYRTWYISAATDRQSTWQDVDLAVNSAAAFFLQLLDIRLPKLEQFIETAIQKNHPASPYYPSSWPILYSLSRWYHGTHQATLIKTVQKNLTQLSKPTALELSLAIICLVNWSAATIDQLTSLIKQLLGQQNAAGSWAAAGFCFDPAVDGQKYLAGADSLTTALAIEALDKYQQLTRRHQANQQPEGKTIIRTTVINQAQDRIRHLSPELRPLAQATLTRVLKTDQHQHLILFPALFAETLPTQLRRQHQINQELLIKLGLANVWGWLAYSLYDDLYDHEAGPEVLSVANLALREVAVIYTGLGATTSALFQPILDTIDSANSWELRHARAATHHHTLTLPDRLPDYTPVTGIAERSLGHALGPLTILLQLGYHHYSQPVQSWLSFMYHYITARQLHDDAHDWETDLVAGRLTPVATMVLQQFLANRPRRRVRLSPATLQRCRALFWHNCLPLVADQINQQLQLANSTLDELTLLEKPQLFHDLIDRLSHNTAQIRQQHRLAEDFLVNFGSH